MENSRAARSCPGEHRLMRRIIGRIKEGNPNMISGTILDAVGNTPLVRLTRMPEPGSYVRNG